MLNGLSAKPLLIVAVLTVAACSEERDYGKCLRTEQYMWLMPVMTGLINGQPITQLQPMWGTRCAEWEFPEGKVPQ